MYIKDFFLNQILNECYDIVWISSSAILGKQQEGTCFFLQAFYRKFSDI